MHLNQEQLQTIKAALEYACVESIAEFERNRQAESQAGIQRAIRAANNAKRFDALLSVISEDSDSLSNGCGVN